jgi:hypothetical protein
MKQVFGTITLDPAADLPMDARMEFKPEAFPIEAPAGENTVINWDHFNGVLLQLQITDGQKVFVHGSAVLVAPGVALAARHVLEPFLPLLSKGNAALYCGGITPSQLMIWQCNQFTLVGDESDIAILVLSYSSDLPPGNVFRMAVITTRLPKIGDQVAMVGFTASDTEFLRQPMAAQVGGDVRVSIGTVSARYPHGRDRVMMPGPVLEIASSASGGMSGGPVFDHHGLLVGIVASSFSADDHIGPSYVSLLWPALITAIDAKWPNGLHTSGRPLCEFGPLCVIDRIDALQRVSDTAFEYIPWEDA